MTALNPKGIVFFVAFLPQFINPQAPVAAQLWTLSTTFVVMAVLVTGAYAVFAVGVRRWLSSPGANRPFNIVGGSLLCAAGAWALSARRASL